jgi:hypothetical protein
LCKKSQEIASLTKITRNHITYKKSSQHKKKKKKKKKKPGGVDTRQFSCFPVPQIYFYLQLLQKYFIGVVAPTDREKVEKTVDKDGTPSAEFLEKLRSLRGPP